MNDYFHPVLFERRKKYIFVEKFKIIVQMLGTFLGTVMTVT
jgi:hypothetical protein